MVGASLAKATVIQIGTGLDASGNLIASGPLESVLKIQKNPIFGGGLGDCSTIKMHKHAISY